MYLETKPGSMSQDEVNEATAALKGMLGIGGKTSAPTRDSTTPKPAAAAAGGGPESGAAPDQQKPKKKNNKKNKKNANSTNAKTADGTSAQRTAPKGNNNANKTNKQEKRATNNAGRGKPKGKGKGGNVKSSAHNSSSPAKDENFAWSAFQSSPDASNLPLPAFSSPSSDKPLIDGDAVVEVMANKDLQQQQQVPNQTTVAASEPDKPEVGSTPSEAPKSTPRAADETKEIESSDGTAPEANGVAPVPAPAPPPASATGVNLAAAVSSRNAMAPAPLSAHPHFNPMSPQSHMGMYPGHHAPGFSSPMSPQMQQHHHQMRLAQQQQVRYAAPPPGFVTIQVQVPMNLMPGRQMFVTAPGGFPVQVVVPEGIYPGSIIPVHVPLQPLHMMPPMQAPHQGQQNQQQQPAAFYQQQQQRPQQQQTQNQQQQKQPR